MENTLPKRAVLYIRVATESQLDDFVMGNQSARLHQQAERDKTEIVGEIRAYEKGITLDRPGWCSAVKLAVEKQADAILVTNIDRAARGLEQYHQLLSELDKHNLSLRTCNGETHSLPELERFLMHAAQPR